jgi:hypothetical protein
MNNWCICWLFTHIFTGILIFKLLTARRLYKSFGVKGLTLVVGGGEWPFSRPVEGDRVTFQYENVLEKREYISFVGNQTTIPRSSREQPVHCTELSIPAPVVLMVRKLCIG